jgi:Flp pilus assembly protein TadD
VVEAPPFVDSQRIIRDRLIATFGAMDATDAAIPAVFRLIADLDAVDAAVLIKLSRHVAAEGNHQAALGLAQDAVEREPQNAEALRHVASLLAKAGRHQEARARRSEAEALAVTFSCPAAQA